MKKHKKNDPSFSLYNKKEKNKAKLQKKIHKQKTVVLFYSLVQ